MLLLASGIVHGKRYRLLLVIVKKGVQIVPVSGGSATATLKFLLSVKYLYVS